MNCFCCPSTTAFSVGAVIVAGGRATGETTIREGENLAHAELLAGRGAGTWRFEIAGARPGSLRPVAGAVLLLGETEDILLCPGPPDDPAEGRPDEALHVQSLPGADGDPAVAALDAAVRRKKIFDAIRALTIRGAALRPLVLGTVYDPTFGDDARNFLGVDAGLARANHRRVNAVIGELGERYGAVADLHAHFLTGTPEAIEGRGSVLFWEDVGEEIYRLDRMLTQLERSGTFAGLQAMVIGSVGPGQRESAVSVEEVRAWLAGRFSGAPFPVVSGFPAGHLKETRTIPLGARMRVDLDRADIDFPGPAVA